MLKVACILTKSGVLNGPLEFESARKIWPLLELLAKIWWLLACSCSQNFCNCSHARIFLKIPSHVAQVQFASWKQKLTLEAKFPVWETRNYWGNMHPPWMFLVVVDVYWNWPGTLKHFACKGGLSLTFLRGSLLACKQGLGKLQIPFNVHPLTLTKLSEVILEQTAYEQGIFGCKLLRMVEPW